MATNNGRGIPTLPSALIRPAARPPRRRNRARSRPPRSRNAIRRLSRGRGAEPRATTAATRPRRRRASTTTAAEQEGRGLYLTDGVWERLQLEAIRKKTTISAICEDTLARNLPRLRIEGDG